MSDEVDRANDQAQQMLDLQLKARKSVIAPKGACHYCDEPLHDGLFCNADCRDDFEKEQRAKERNGNPT
jgi:hypothetical protein